MPLIYDLHCHSTASDGVLEPAELVQRARRMGVDVLALTDHDVLDGIAEARLDAAGCGLVLVPGVEISVTWRRRVIHVLGLNVAVENPLLRAGLETLARKRERRTDELGRRLEKLGIPGALEGARRLTQGRIVSRTHFARYLVEQGYARDFKAAFKRYLGQGKKAYVNCEWASLEESVSWIRAAGGQAVIAHPARYRLSRSLFVELIEAFRAVGGEGIEVVSSSHSRQENLAMAAFARQFGLLASAGSDFHEPAANWAELGRVPALPANCIPIWHDWGLEEEVCCASALD